MEPITASLLLGSSAVSALGSLISGSSAKRAAELNAYNIETETKLNQAEASQRASARMEEYRQATSANEATFAAMGRDIGSDRSVKAFMDKQKETVGKDVGRVQNQAELQRLQGVSRAGAERTAGRAARTASLLNAAQTMTSGIYKYQDAK